MRNIFQSPMLTEAAIVRDLLVENGIDARLIEGQSPYPNLSSSEVWIPRDDDAEQAMQIVRSLYAKQEQRDSWKCAECDEVNPPSFDVCWHCGAARPK